MVAFADSDTGRVYARDCERWGIVPGAFLDDDVMAFNLRVAMSWVAGKDAELEPESPFEIARRKHAEAFSG